MRIARLLKQLVILPVVFLSCLFVSGCQKHLSKHLPLSALQVSDRSNDFADIFCQLLSNEKRPDGRSWGICSNWLNEAKPHAVTLPRFIEKTYRVLLIGGYGSDCLTGAHATFMDSIEHLRRVHDFNSETLAVAAFGSSEFNSKQIADYVSRQFVTDQRKYIALGYSKGAADLQVAIADRPGVREKLAALVTLAGVIQGSRLVGVPDVTGLPETQRNPIGCTAGDLAGLNSMTPAVRKGFLAQHPNPLLPTYSIAAYSNRSETSNMLIPFWDSVAQYGKIEDSQMIAEESIYPRGNYLGLMTRDHWAIAIPFESSALVNKTEFPRPQLFEAILRFVIQDLDAQLKQTPK